LLPFTPIGAHGCWAEFEQKGDFCVGEHTVLLVSLGEEAGDGLFFHLAQFGSLGAGFNLAGGQEIEHDGSQLALDNGFAVAAFLVFVDSGPADLSLNHMEGAGEMGGHQLGDGGHQSLPGAKAAELGTLLSQEGVESTLEGFKALGA
jgi:hypothetical protein